MVKYLYLQYQPNQMNQQTSRFAKFWTADKLALLERLYHETNNKELAEFLGCTALAVRQKASRLGLTKNAGATQWMKENNPAKTKEGKERASQLMKNLSFRKQCAETQAENKRANLSITEQFVCYALKEFAKRRFKTQVVVMTAEKVYTVDFLVGGKTIIEIDGEHWHGHPSKAPFDDRQLRQIKNDKEKTKALQEIGFKVVRIWESEVSINKIKEVLAEENSA